MIWITGDTHGDFGRYAAFTHTHHPTEEDLMIVLGDAGLNVYGGEHDTAHKRFVNSVPFTTFCIHGNHEKRPFDIPSYRTKEFCGGTVWYEEEYPRILFAKDGELYRLGELSCLVIGGAYSVDKPFRLARGWAWFDNEQPSDDIRRRVEEQLAAHDYRVDVVLSHTCPLPYEPTEVFLPWLDQSGIDKSTERWLGELESRLHYRKWYCGHFHTEKTVDRLRFLYETIEPFGV